MSKIIGRPLYAPAPAGGGQTAGNLAVGSSVFTNVNGIKTEFIVVHQGKPSSLYDDSCNGTWLLMKDIYENRQWNSSDNNSYKVSTINSYLNSTFLNLFNSNIKDAIRQIKIPYVDGTGGSPVASGANGLPCKIFLLSGYEVGWTNKPGDPFPVDGAKLDYFTAGYNGKPKRIAYLNGAAANWWLRSSGTGVAYVHIVYSNGNASNFYASTSHGVRPAFIIPSETNISKSGLIKP